MDYSDEQWQIGIRLLNDHANEARRNSPLFRPPGTALQGVRQNDLVKLNVKSGGEWGMTPSITCMFMVGLPGFEPGTSASRTQRANQAAPQPVDQYPSSDRSWTREMLPDGRGLGARTVGRPAPFRRDGRRIETFGHHLGDAALVHLGDQEFPAVDVE
jgi:hypothetical protein